MNNVLYINKDVKEIHKLQHIIRKWDTRALDDGYTTDQRLVFKELARAYRKALDLKINA